jgi:hypothetical protein
MTKSKQSKQAVTTVTNLSKRNPRIKLKGRLNENVSMVCGNEYNVAAANIAGESYGYGAVVLAPGNVSGRSNAAVQRIGQYFQKGIFLPGTSLTFIPSVGLNTPGNIIIGFLDSPEQIRFWSVLTPGSHLNFIRDLNNARTGPIWQELNFPLTQAPRRRIFTVDTALSPGDMDQVDQSMQGMWVYCVYGVPATTPATTYGQLALHCKCRFEEAKSFVTT